MPKILNNEPAYLMSLVGFIDHIDESSPIFEGSDMEDVLYYKSFLNTVVTEKYLRGETAIVWQRKPSYSMTRAAIKNKLTFAELAEKKGLFYFNSVNFNSLLYDIKEKYLMDRD